MECYVIGRTKTNEITQCTSTTCRLKHNISFSLLHSRLVCFQDGIGNLSDGKLYSKSTQQSNERKIFTETTIAKFALARPELISKNCSSNLINFFFSGYFTKFRTFFSLFHVFFSFAPCSLPTLPREAFEREPNKLFFSLALKLWKLPKNEKETLFSLFVEWLCVCAFTCWYSASAQSLGSNRPTISRMWLRSVVNSTDPRNNM